MTASLSESSRRSFLKSSTAAAAATTLLSGAASGMYAGQDSTIQLALVGCGGRGTGAAGNALSIDTGPMKLVAMADVFDKNLKASHENLKKRMRATASWMFQKIVALSASMATRKRWIA